MPHLLRAGALIVLTGLLLAACSPPAEPTPTLAQIQATSSFATSVPVDSSSPPAAYLLGLGTAPAALLIEEACWHNDARMCYDNALGSIMPAFVQGAPGGLMRLHFDPPYPASGSMLLSADSFDGRLVDIVNMALTDGEMTFTLPANLTPGQYALQVQAIWADPPTDTATYKIVIAVGQ